jgi:outer membrane protein OmpA-like peptidoglycan-associated protein
MTPSRTLLASLLLPAAAILTAPIAQAEIRMQEVARGALTDTPPPIQLAQKVDDGDNKERKGKHRDKGKADDKGAGGPPSGDANSAAQKRQEAQQAREEARKQKQQERQQAKENLLKKKQELDTTRQDAIKQRQLERQQAKEKAGQQKRDAEAGRQKAIEEKRLQLQQTRDNALKQKQDAEAARQNALKQKQLEAQQARDKAVQQKRDAEAARQKAVQDKRDAEAQRLKAIKDRNEADAARRKAVQDNQRQDRWGKGRRAPEKFDRAKVDQEFDRARREAEQKGGRDRSEKFEAAKASKFERFRRERKTREVGSRDIIIEPDKRVIVRDQNRVFILHDDGERFRRKGKEIKRERRKDGTWMVVTAGLAGALIYSILDDNDRVLRRSRRDRDGREYVFFDDRRSYRDHYGPEHYSYIDLPPPEVRIPRDRYIVEYDRASPDDLYDALNAPPIETLDRGYTLDEVRQNYSILARMRRVDLNSINFEFASWDVTPDQYPKLERIARAMQRVLDRSAGELFLVEGHTDAVGSEIDNLSLSDRRAESVAIILTDEFGIPAENLTTQGYGEEYLKEPTDGPSWINRRVGVRRITPLLSREGWDDPN